MDGTIAAQSQAYPVFILPAALNACAEEAGRALVELLLRTPAVSAPGPVLVIEGDGLTDLRESIQHHMLGLAAASRDAAAVRAPAQHYSIIGEGGMAPAPLFIEMDAALAADLPPPVPELLGVLVRCRDARAMLSLAARYAGMTAGYVQAQADDAPLAQLLQALLAPSGMSLTVSAKPVPAPR